MKLHWFRSLLLLIFMGFGFLSAQAEDTSGKLLQKAEIWAEKHLAKTCDVSQLAPGRPVMSLLAYHYEMPPGKKPKDGGVNYIVRHFCYAGGTANIYSVYFREVSEGDFELLEFEKPVLVKSSSSVPDIRRYVAGVALANATFDSNTFTLIAHEPLNEGGPGEWSEGEWYFDGNRFVLKKYSVGLYASSVGGEPHFKEVQLLPK